MSTPNILRKQTAMVLGFLFLALSTVASGQFVSTTKAPLPQMLQSEWTTQLAWGPDGKQIISGGLDGNVQFIDAANGKLVYSVKAPAEVIALAVSKNGRVAVGDSTGMVSLITNGKGIDSSFRADKAAVNAVAWSEEGDTLAAGGDEGIVRLWSDKDAKLSGELSLGHTGISALAFAGNALTVGVKNGDLPKRSAEVWDWQNKKLVRTFDEGPAGLRAIAASSDHKYLAVADFREGLLLTMLPTTGGGAEVSLRITPDDDDPIAVAIWDLASGKRAGLFNAETGARSVAYSNDGKYLATAGTNGVVIYDNSGGTMLEIGRIDTLTPIDSISFSPDSKTIAIARESEALIKTGPTGRDKLVDPIFVAFLMPYKGLTSIPGVKVTSDTSKKGSDSLTGGSNIEIWQINTLAAPHETALWNAVLAWNANKPDDAQKMIQQIVKDKPNYGEAMRLQALLFEGRSPDKALHSLEAATKAGPSCVSCWRSLGDLQYGLKKYDDAIASYDKALQLRPDYGLIVGREATAWGAIGLALESTDNNQKTIEAAITALSKAIQLRPGNDQFYANVGSAAYFGSDFDDAIKFFDAARRLRPDHSRIYYNLGHAYRSKGDKQHAIENYTRYVQMGEEGEEARVANARKLIEELKK